MICESEKERLAHEFFIQIRQIVAMICISLHIGQVPFPENGIGSDNVVLKYD